MTMPQMQLPPHAIGRSLVDSMNVTRGSNNTSYSQLPHGANNNNIVGGVVESGGHDRQVSTTDALLATLGVPPASAFKEVTFLKSEDEEEMNMVQGGGGTQQQPQTTTTSPTLARRSQSPTSTNPADDMIAVTFFPEPVTLDTTFDGKANSLVVSPIAHVGNNNNNTAEQQQQAPQLVTFCTCCTAYFLYQGAQSNNSNNTTTKTSNPLDTSGNFSRGGVRGHRHGAAVDVVHLKRIYPRQTLIMDSGSSCLLYTSPSPRDS
eukprot:TRINITY_DN55963_c0_g1_i1.p1 TRINITY_DN55963_c0_g1~~TRINITY_DN55963_c0_g1_i1.p1  ORF type:complete len:262 (+),score=49.89 TRINITY_DN55963_c0_g1_i1:213-998(+)